MTEEFYGTKPSLIPGISSGINVFGVGVNPLQILQFGWDIARAHSRMEHFKVNLPRLIDDTYVNLGKLRNWTTDQILEWGRETLKDLFAEDIEKQLEYGVEAKTFGLSGQIGLRGWEMWKLLSGFEWLRASILDANWEYGFTIPVERATRKYFSRARLNPRDAFRLYCKKKLGQKYLMDVLEEDIGLPRDVAEKYLDLLDYTPSPSELVRMRRAYPVSDEYVDECLREHGVVGKDFEEIKKWIKYEGLKDEYSSFTRYLTSEFQYGFLSRSALREFFGKVPSAPEEIELKVYVAEILRKIYVGKLLRDKWIYLYRNGRVVEDTLYRKLKELGMDAEVANAIVQLEAARKGIEWSA